MESLSIGDSVTDRIVRQLAEDSESIQQTLDHYQAERVATVKAQNLALAAYDAEIKEIEDSMNPTIRYYRLCPFFANARRISLLCTPLFPAVMRR